MLNFLFLKISNLEYNSHYHYKVSTTLLNFPYSLLIFTNVSGQVGNSEIPKTTEITEKAVKQENY